MMKSEVPLKASKYLKHTAWCNIPENNEPTFSFTETTEGF
jgi:hypothetical protein